MENQQALILTMNAEDESHQLIINKSVNKIEDYKSKLKSLKGKLCLILHQRLGWEGQASKVYFETLNMFIPDKYHFESRSQHPATDIVNALLNYGYGFYTVKLKGI